MMKPGDKFECACGRAQSYAPAGEPGGITADEAVECGWVKLTDGKWSCPFCSGNMDKLKKVFGGKRPGLSVVHSKCQKSHGGS